MKATRRLMEQADLLASDLVSYAQEAGLSADELLELVVCSQRILQAVCFPGNPQRARHTVQVANATFDAMSQSLEGN